MTSGSFTLRPQPVGGDNANVSASNVPSVSGPFIIDTSLHNGKFPEPGIACRAGLYPIGDNWRRRTG